MPKTMMPIIGLYRRLELAVLFRPGRSLRGFPVIRRLDNIETALPDYVLAGELAGADRGDAVVRQLPYRYAAPLAR